MNEIIDREAAHVQGLTHYFTGEACSHGHVAKRYVSTGGCVACLKRYQGKYTAVSISRELACWTPTERLHIPAGLSLEQQRHLEVCLQDWVKVWATQQGLLTETMTASIDAVVRHRLARVKQP